MKAHEILISYPKTAKEVKALRVFMEAMNIEFEIKERPYNPDFVEKILNSKKQIAQGKFTEVKQENLKSFIDSL